MAIDIISTPVKGFVTVVHDDQELEITALALMADGEVSAHDGRRRFTIGRLAASMIRELRACRRAAVVRMQGDRVASTEIVPLMNLLAG